WSVQLACQLRAKRNQQAGARRLLLHCDARWACRSSATPKNPQEQIHLRLKLGLTEPQRAMGSTATRIFSEIRRAAGHFSQSVDSHPNPTRDTRLSASREILSPTACYNRAAFRTAGEPNVSGKSERQNDHEPIKKIASISVFGVLEAQCANCEIPE